MVNVAYLCEFTSLNGGENSLLTFLCGIADRLTATILCPAEGPFVEKMRQSDIHHVPFDFQDPAGARKSADLLHTELIQTIGHLDVDVLHANSLSTSRLVGTIARQLPCLTVGHVRDIMRLSDKVVTDLNRLDQMIAVSDATRQSLVDQGIQGDRITRIYNGVNVDEFCAVKTRPTRWKQKLRLPADVLLIGAAGQIGLRKGWHFLCDAVEKLVTQFPNVHLLIAGERYSRKQESEQFESDLMARENAGPLAGRLHLLGYVQDMPSYLQELDLLAHAALQEPLGRVLLEAAACKTPVVATDVGGTIEIFGEDSALLAPPGNVQSLADTLAQALRFTDAGKIRATRARQRIDQLFSVERFQANILQLYQQSLKG